MKTRILILLLFILSTALKTDKPAYVLFDGDGKQVGASVVFRFFPLNGGRPTKQRGVLYIPKKDLPFSWLTIRN